MKKPTENINRSHTIPSLWILIILVSFFSSCTVRKGIQANLEIPVTKQLNPSKAVSGYQSLCHYSQTDLITKALNKEVNSGPGFLHTNKEGTFKQKKLFYNPKGKIISGWPLTSKIESYILFRQMKSWINHQDYFLQDNTQG